jgi:hypothetical protein
VAGVIALVAVQGVVRRGPVFRCVDARPGGSLDVGKPLDPFPNGDVLGPDAEGAAFFLLLFEPGYQGGSPSLRESGIKLAGFGFRVAVVGQLVREVLEAPAPPFGAHALRKPGSEVDREPEGFGICPFLDYERSG